MRVEVIRAWPRRFESRTVELPEGSNLDQAIQAAGWCGDPECVAVALHGERVAAATPLREGDRVEMLRALVTDPKESRRRRAKAAPPG